MPGDMPAAMLEGMPGDTQVVMPGATLAAMKQRGMPEAALRHFCRRHCLPIRKV